MGGPGSGRRPKVIIDEPQAGAERYQGILYPLLSAGREVGAVIYSAPYPDGTGYTNLALFALKDPEVSQVLGLTYLRYEPTDQGLMGVRRTTTGRVTAVSDKKDAWSRRLALVRLADEARYECCYRVCDPAAARAVRPLDPVYLAVPAEGDIFLILSGMINSLTVPLADGRVVHLGVSGITAEVGQNGGLLVIPQSPPVLYALVPDWTWQEVQEFALRAGLAS